MIDNNILNDYGNKIVNKFLDKCKTDGSYKRVYEDFEDGTWLLENTIENLYDVCAWLYLTYDRYVFDTLNEWKNDGFNYVWMKNNNKVTFEEVENELHKMFLEN